MNKNEKKKKKKKKRGAVDNFDAFLNCSSSPRGI